MYCSKCGNKLNETDLFCKNCGTKLREVENNHNEEKDNINLNNTDKPNNVSKSNWIKNTNIAKKCRENEKTRKIVAIVIVIIMVILFFIFINGIASYLDSDIYLSAAKGVNDIIKIKYWEDKLTGSKFQMIGSVICAILVLHYGKKIVEKD